MFNRTKGRQESNRTIRPLFCLRQKTRGSVLFVISIIVVGGMLVDISAAPVQNESADKFAEVEIFPGDKFGIEHIRALPRAPGSAFEVLDSPKRVRVQLPANEIKAIIDGGADITVVRRFVLVEGFGGGAMGLDAGMAATQSCSGPYRYGENPDNVPIPDDGSGWVYSTIAISGAPGGATVTCVDVHYEIIHTYVSDLVVDLSDQDLTYEHNLWYMEGGSGEDIYETETGITTFNGELVNQIWLLWAIDTFAFLDEGYINYWWIKVYYGEVPPPPPNDDCNDAIAVTEAVPYSSSTVGATEDGQSSCGYNDTADVWHSYTPTSTGLVTISLAGSVFGDTNDTTLAVFDECGGTELACNDDSHCSYLSEVVMNMTAATTYLIRIAGYNNETGDYTLTVTNSGCALPAEPNGPSPANDVNNVSLEAILSWNGGEGVVSASGGAITPEVIYGQDDRLDEYEVNDANILVVGDSTVMLVSRSVLIDNNDGTFSLPTETYAEWYLWADPIYTGNPLCSDEPFRDQPNPAWCSGFLVAPDIIATAGHCACPGYCADTAVVFGFVMVDANTPVVTIDESEIYYCSEVITSQTGYADWALIRLDREVTGHSPLRVRTQGTVGDGEELLVIGHPVGLPRKYAGGATVRDNTTSAYFKANLDTYAGNSGSAVLNANTLHVEGIVVRGNPDFVPDGGCDRSNVCPDEGCPDWEDVTRATEFAALLPLESYDVYCDTNSPPTQLLCSDTNEPVCDPTPEPNAALKPCTTYYWRIVSKNFCSETEGPIWSFTTASVAADFDKDCDVDFEDLAELVLYWLENEPSVNIAAPDDVIDFADYAALAEDWLWSEEP